MHHTISGHFRDNVVGYIALFLVLTGGTAYALDGANTVFTDDIVDGEVRNADIRSGSVTTGKIANGDVLTEDLAFDAVRGDRVADGSLTGADLADRSIGGQKVGVGTLAGINVADGSLSGADIADGGISAADILDGTVGAADIGANAVGTGELASSAFEPSDIARKSILDPRFGIVPNAIQSDEVSDNSLTGADINESTLDTPEAAYVKNGGARGLPSEGNEIVVVRRVVEAGNYVVLAKSSLSSSDGEFVHCRLNAERLSDGQSNDLDEITLPTVKKSFGLPGAYEGLSMLGIYGYSGGSIQLDLRCWAPGSPWTRPASSRSRSTA